MEVAATRPRIGRLHVLTDIHLQNRFSHADLAAMAVAGGADAVQVREKVHPPEWLLPEIIRIQDLQKTNSFQLIINDHLSLAIEAGADGIHVGLADHPTGQCRQAFIAARQPGALIGATIHSLQELTALKQNEVDYIGVGPVFGTQSKNTGLPPLGLEKLAEICSHAKVPVIAIGNIRAEQLPEVLHAGAWGVAVLGAICLAPDPLRATRRFAEILF